MKAVVQRVTQASVTVNNEIVGKINAGLLVFLGIHRDDTEKHIAALVEKIINLRIFEDQSGKMNHSILESKGSLLVVSQFTLYGDCSKGNRPSFIEAAEPAKAEKYYEEFIQHLKSRDITVASGKFRSYMEVSLINDGPTTLILDV